MVRLVSVRCSQLFDHTPNLQSFRILYWSHSLSQIPSYMVIFCQQKMTYSGYSSRRIHCPSAECHEIFRSVAIEAVFSVILAIHYLAIQVSERFHHIDYETST